MIEIVDANDARAVRNKNSIVQFYELMYKQRRPTQAVAMSLAPAYIQHNPVVPDSAAGLAKFLGDAMKDRPLARVVIHRIIAAGDYVWAHVNFLNLFNDDPSDTGIAGVDIFKMGSNGKAVEHWDCLQLVGTENNAAPWLAPNLPRANPNGML